MFRCRFDEELPAWMVSTLDVTLENIQNKADLTPKESTKNPEQIVVQHEKHHLQNVNFQ